MSHKMASVCHRKRQAGNSSDATFHYITFSNASPWAKTI